MKLKLMALTICCLPIVLHAQVPLSELRKKAEKKDYPGGLVQDNLQVQEVLLKPPRNVYRSQVQKQVYDELFKKEKSQ